MTTKWTTGAVKLRSRGLGPKGKLCRFLLYSAKAIEANWFAASLSIGILLWAFGTYRFTDSHTNVLDAALQSVQLFVLNSQDKKSGDPWLYIPKFLAPIFTFNVIVAAFYPRLVRALQNVILSSASGHIIICGLGTKGLAVAKACQSDPDCQGLLIVAIDKQPTSGSEDEFREATEGSGILLVGDFRDKAVLLMANCNAASRVFISGSDDSENLTATQALKSLNPPEGDKLNTPKVFIHLQQTSLVTARQREGNDSDLGTPYSLIESTARLTLVSYPAFSMTDDGVLAPRRVAIIGYSAISEAMLIEIADLWHTETETERKLGSADHSRSEAELPRPKDLAQMQVYLVGEALQEAFRIISFNESNVKKALCPKFFKDIPNLIENTVDGEIELVYLPYDDTTDAIRILRQLERLPNETEVVCTSWQPNPLRAVIEARSDRKPNVNTYGLLDDDPKLTTVLGQTFEEGAQIVHKDIYSSNVEWDKASYEHRCSSRRCIHRLVANLYASNLRLFESMNPNRVHFNDTVVEEMAKREHEAWRRERASNGWVCKSVENRPQKELPTIRAWRSGDDSDVLTKCWETNIKTFKCNDKYPSLIRELGFEVKESNF